jgi:hypothetical protein
MEDKAITLGPLKELVVKDLTPSLRDDFLQFFDTVAFADNPDWSDCYCSAYHFANNKGKAESRREASNQIEEGGGQKMVDAFAESRNCILPLDDFIWIWGHTGRLEERFGGSE